MLSKMKNKLFLISEAPTFAAKEDDLIQVLGIMTRILDGHGYESDTGAHGHRGYCEEMMFTWIWRLLIFQIKCISINIRPQALFSKVA